MAEDRETARILGRTGGFFGSVPTPAYGSFRLVQNVRPSIKYFGNLPWESHLRKTKSKYQRSVDRSIVDLEYLTGKQSNCIEACTGTSQLQSSSKERCHENFVNKFWQEHNLYCLFYGQRRNILIENLYDHNFPSKSTIDHQISEMLSLSCTALDLMTETVNFSASRKSTSIFSITRC